MIENNIDVSLEEIDDKIMKYNEDFSQKLPDEKIYILKDFSDNHNKISLEVLKNSNERSQQIIKMHIDKINDIQKKLENPSLSELEKEEFFKLIVASMAEIREIHKEQNRQENDYNKQSSNTFLKGIGIAVGLPTAAWLLREITKIFTKNK